MPEGNGLQRLIDQLARKLVEHGIAASREHAERIIAVLGAARLLEVVEALDRSRRLSELYQRGGIPVRLPRPQDAARDRDRG